jgi:hypothetical protein
MKKKPANIVTQKGYSVVYAQGVENYFYHKLNAPTAKEQAHNDIAQNVQFWLNQQTNMISIKIDRLKNDKKAPTSHLNVSIDGYAQIKPERFKIDDYKGLVTYYLDNKKTIVLPMKMVRFINRDVFVPEVLIERKHDTKCH